MGTTLAALALSLLGASIPQALPVTPPCTCDCNRNGPVEVSDLVVLINVNLGRKPVTTCPSYVEGGLPPVGFLVQCVEALLDDDDCPLTAPTPTPTRRPSATPVTTATVFPPADAEASASATDLLDVIFVCATGGTPGGRVEIRPEPAGATLDCSSFTGHNGSFSLLKYPSTAEATVAFGQPGPDEELSDLAGGTMRERVWNPFCDDQTTPPCSRPDASSSSWSWQRECWVAGGSTFDDTGFILTPRGPQVVDAMARSGRLEDLIDLCPSP
jgi:hypothetical protein